jgi:hypothetical protein
MKTAIEIVNDPINGRFAYTLLTDEEWQTLKAAVLVAQTNNNQSTQLPVCGGCNKELSLVCLNKNCDWSSVT